MKRSCIILMITAIFVSMAPGALAQPQLALGSVNALPGQTASLDVRLLSAGGEAYAGFNAEVLLPQGVTVTGISKGGLLTDGAFFTDYYTSSAGGNDATALIAYSGKDAFAASSGVLLRMSLRIANSATPGTYPAPFVNARQAMSSAEGSYSVPPATVNGSITVDVDGDGDGIGDGWEQQHFGSTIPANATSDSDGDGLTDLREFKNGTNPKTPDSDGDGRSDSEEFMAGTCGTDSLDYFSVDDCTVVAETDYLILCWCTTTGRLYTVYATADLCPASGEPPTWQSVHQTEGDDSIKTYAHHATDGGCQFFRIGVELLP